MYNVRWFVSNWQMGCIFGDHEIECKTNHQIFTCYFIVAKIIAMSSGPGRFQFSRSRTSSTNSSSGKSTNSPSITDSQSHVPVTSTEGRWSKLGSHDSSSAPSTGRSAQFFAAGDAGGGGGGGQPHELPTFQRKTRGGGGTSSSSGSSGRCIGGAANIWSRPSLAAGGEAAGGGVGAARRELLGITDEFYNAVLRGEQEALLGVPPSEEDCAEDDDSSTGSSSAGSALGFGSQSYRSFQRRTHSEQQGHGQGASSACAELFVRLSRGATCGC